MDFFGMGMGEILLILVVALIIWGPGRIVEVGRTLGKIVRTLRKASFDLTTQLTKELEGEEKDRPSQSRAKRDDKTKKSSDVDTAESGGAGMTSPGDQY
ncbi:twin-arginine translocase TatA/TatE family subunit, partial [Chloroflexota bacterium]